MLHWPDSFAPRARLLRRSAVREFARVSARPGMISFAGGLPAPELFPLEEIRAAARQVLEHDGSAALQYGPSEGVDALRDWIAREHSTDGLHVRREHVLVVSGSQQALDLIGRVLVHDDDGVVVECPTYLALLGAWRPSGARFIPVHGTADGPEPSALAAAFAGGPKLFYAVPNFQNPQGSTWSLATRRNVVRQLHARGVALVEDDPYGALRYRGTALPGLLELDARAAGGRIGAHVIRTGTFSKVLAPGLRVAWIIAHEEVIEKLVQAKQAADLHTATFNQLLVFALVQQGLLDRQIPRLRTEYGRRLDALLEALHDTLPPETSWTRPDGGMFVLVRLPGGLDAATLLPAALARQVAFVPGAEFFPDGSGHDTLRLNFSHPAPEQIRAGIARLGQAVHHARAAGGRHSG